MEDSVARLVKRVETLETSGASSTKGEDDERHRTTLIFGGWPKETPRKRILDQLDAAFGKLELDSLCDGKPFCTGARRSMALLSFQARAGENAVAVRGRMSAMVAAVSNAEIYVGDGGRGDERRLWVAFSRPREVRLNGNHAAMIRRSVRQLAAEKEGDLETEYGTGTVWLLGQKIASARDPPTEGCEADLLRDEDRACRPWVQIKKMAGLLKVSQDRVRQVLGEQKR